MLCLTLGIFKRKLRNHSHEDPFLWINDKKTALHEFLDLTTFNSSSKKKIDAIRKINENREINLKMRESRKFYWRLLNDVQKTREWNDLSVEMLLHDKRGLTRR